MPPSSPLFPQAKTKQIGKCSYTVEPLPWRKGRAALVRLSNACAPALAKLDARSKESFEASGVDALATFAERLRDEDLEYFEELFRPITTVTLPDGKMPMLSDLPEHFAPGGAGDLKSYFEWLWFSCETSFGDFFSEALRKGAKSSSESPTKPTSD